jgi:hypothetical protein
VALVGTDVSEELNASVVPGSLIHFTMMMEWILPSETSVLKRITLRHIPEDGILQDKVNSCHIIYI